MKETKNLKILGIVFVGLLLLLIGLYFFNKDNSVEITQDNTAHILDKGKMDDFGDVPISAKNDLTSKELKEILNKKDEEIANFEDEFMSNFLKQDISDLLRDDLTSKELKEILNKKDERIISAVKKMKEIYEAEENFEFGDELDKGIFGELGNMTREIEGDILPFVKEEKKKDFDKHLENLMYIFFVTTLWVQ